MSMTVSLVDAVLHVDDAWRMVSLVTVMVVGVTYAVVGAAFLVLDLTQRPVALYQYKIQRTKSVATSQVKTVVRQLGFLFAFVLVPCATLLGWSRRLRVSSTFPSLAEMGKDVVVFMIVEEVRLRATLWRCVNDDFSF